MVGHLGISLVTVTHESVKTLLILFKSNKIYRSTGQLLDCTSFLTLLFHKVVWRLMILKLPVSYR